MAKRTVEEEANILIAQIIGVCILLFIAGCVFGGDAGYGIMTLWAGWVVVIIAKIILIPNREVGAVITGLINKIFK